MRYASTRDPKTAVSLSEAVEAGLARDGGLFVPQRFPSLYLSDFGTASGLVDVGQILLAPFFDGDPLSDALDDVCRESLDLHAPLVRLDDSNSVLELYHGPTAAFKDFGARFLASLLSRVASSEERALTVLTATSGDTGGAVGAGFHGRPGVRVVILYPAGRVSPRQEAQLTGWSDNVRTLRVRGDFDDCQRLVKQAFADPDLRSRLRLTSANSINLGRLLPQMVYYAHAALEHLRERGEAPGFIVPSGNLGNAVACLWAREMGVPIREVVLATNANEAIAGYMETGVWEPAPTRTTLASAMDVGDPSNFERLQHLASWARLRRRVRAIRVPDEEIARQIRIGPEVWGRVWDPHTATAAAALDQLEPRDWIVVATAHPAKFEATVEPLVGHALEVPPALRQLLGREPRFEEIDPSIDALRHCLLDS
jgi:threonine synthase